MKLRHVYTLGVVALLVVGQVYAQSDPLTSATVKRFIDSMSDVQQIAKKYGNDERIKTPGSMDEAMQRAATPFSSALADMQAFQGYNEMAAAIKQHGFSSTEQWALIGDRVIRAYAATKMELEAPNMNQQMAEAMEQIQSSQMSDEQKQMMMQMMQSSNQAMQAFSNVPKSDKAAVRPHLAAIDDLSNQ